MERARDYTVRGIEAIEASDLTSRELLYAATHLERPSHAYRVEAVGADGASERLEVLHFESTRRSGITHQGEAWWLNAACAEEALHLWIERAGQRSGRRSEGGSEAA